MRVIRFADLEPVAWKNGGGVTVEIAIHPPDAGLDAFDWRVSAAEIRHSGPFSRFEEIVRTLMILEGEGLALNIDGREVCVRLGDSPAVFPGESRVEARLLEGAVRDLNVMVRRSVWRVEVERRRLTPGAKLAVDVATVIVAIDACVMTWGGERASLMRKDALAMEPGEQAILDQPGPADIIVVAFHRAK